MAAEASVRVFAEVTGLGKELSFIEKGSSQTTPTAATYNYRVLATADTAEALDLGDISTVLLIVIKAIDNDLDIDLDFVSSFDADLTLIPSGPPAVIPNPSGTVYVKNNDASETPAYEYIVVGTT